jgi:hypothetical protein
MADRTQSFKKTFVVNMTKITHEELPVLTVKGRALPIKKINGITQPKETIEVFADQPINTMIAQYSVLSKMVYEGACTITQYIDEHGNPIVTLFPNNNLDPHQENWNALLSKPAREDFIELYKKQQRIMDSARGALLSLNKK